MTQLDLTSWSPRVSVPREPRNRPSIDERAQSFHLANPHVLEELLRLARARLDRGDTFISVKALWEECRVSLSTKHHEYKLNNTYTAWFARRLLEVESRLNGVIEVRRRKHG